VAIATYRYRPLADVLASRAPAAAATEGAAPLDPKQLKKLEGETAKLVAALERKRPRSSYVVVDRTNNLLYLRDSSGTVLQAVCSAGSGSILKDPAGNRTWVFDTPRGAFKVISILEKPAWRKPDWAFIEEGEPIPKNAGDRIEYGMLGEYGLYFGDGFLIHGTLYERLLGRNVTHGCIRLGKKDLREVVQATRLGTQIYIF
jgi:lipoprotein-anchoring transpeptidase ErfK/SrfK